MAGIRKYLTVYEQGIYAGNVKGSIKYVHEKNSRGMRMSSLPHSDEEWRFKEITRSA